MECESITLRRQFSLSAYRVQMQLFASGFLPDELKQCLCITRTISVSLQFLKQQKKKKAEEVINMEFATCQHMCKCITKERKK